MAPQQIAAVTRTHDTQLHAFHTYVTLQNQLKQQIIAAVDEPYIAELRHPTLGYAQTTAKQLLQHLIMAYGQLQTADLEANRQRLQEPWDPTKDITELWTKVAQIRHVAFDNHAPIDDRATIHLVRTALLQAGVYGQAIQMWDIKATHMSTFADFKSHINKCDKV